MSRLLNEKEIKYHSYILKHTTNVGNAYYWLYKNKIITDENNEINNLIIAHDESKFLKCEFSQYANYFYGEKTEKVKKILIMLGYITFTTTHTIGNIGF